MLLLTVASAGCASTGSPAPRGANEQSTESESQAIARRFLGDGGGTAAKAGPAYQWLTVGTLYWVSGPAEPGLLVAAPGGGRPPVRLTGDIAALEAFLAMQYSGRLPGVSVLNDIAQLVKDATFGKRGRIATPEFFDAQFDVVGRIDDWFEGHDNYDPADFARLCPGIRASLDKNAWTIEFNVFNSWGGVDVVRASGTASPLTLQQVNIDVVKPHGEFNYPLVD